MQVAAKPYVKFLCEFLEDKLVDRLYTSPTNQIKRVRRTTPRRVFSNEPQDAWEGME